MALQEVFEEVEDHCDLKEMIIIAICAVLCCVDVALVFFSELPAFAADSAPICN